MMSCLSMYIVTQYHMESALDGIYAALTRSISDTSTTPTRA